MTAGTVKDPQIGPVAPENRTQALRLVVSRVEEQDRQRQLQRLLASTSGSGLSSSELLGAYRDGRLTGVVFWQTQPGKTAAVWPPRIVAGEPPATAAMLLRCACDRLARQNVCMAQVLLAAGTASDVAILQQGGFECLAALLYLVSPEIEFPEGPPPGLLEFEPYTPANHRRLGRVVEATYGQTLDCPRLNGIRQIEDVLEGYRATGAFDPNRWLIVRHDGRDVGCLLMADHSEDGNYELVYMGVVDSARGQGWGIEIARQAQWRTRQAGRARLVLAVDADNGPALKIYAAAGFRAWERRSAYVKVFGASGRP